MSSLKLVRPKRAKILLHKAATFYWWGHDLAPTPPQPPTIHHTYLCNIHRLCSAISTSVFNNSLSNAANFTDFKAIFFSATLKKPWVGLLLLALCYILIRNRDSLPTQKLDTTPLLERLPYMLPLSLDYDFTCCPPPPPSGFTVPLLKIIAQSPRERPFELGDQP